MSKRPTFDVFKAKAPQEPECREEYDATDDDYPLKRRLIAMRNAAGRKHAQMAEKLGTTKSSISRLQSITVEHSSRPGSDRGLHLRVGLCCQSSF